MAQATLAVKAGRLRSSAAIRAVLAGGRTTHRDTVVVHALAREDPDPARAAVVAGRKVGGAVERNRAKRRLRAALDAADLPPSVDLVIVARRAATSAPFDRIVTDLRAGVQP